jgi:hypothetical protein
MLNRFLSTLLSTLKLYLSAVGKGASQDSCRLLEAYVIFVSIEKAESWRVGDRRSGRADELGGNGTKPPLSFNSGWGCIKHRLSEGVQDQENSGDRHSIVMIMISKPDPRRTATPPHPRMHCTRSKHQAASNPRTRPTLLGRQVSSSPHRSFPPKQKSDHDGSNTHAHQE